MARRKQNWSLEEISKMERIIKSYPDKNKGIKIAAKYFKVSEGAISARHRKYLKGIDVPAPVDSSNIAQRVSAIKSAIKPRIYKGKPPGAKSWSKSEISTLKSAVAKASDKHQGFIDASSVLNRSLSAIEAKYRNCTKRSYVPRVKKTTENKPIPNTDTTRSLTFDIKEVSVDLSSKKLTIYY